MRLKPQRLSTAAVLIAVAGTLRAVLGLAVRSLIAQRFGITSGETDAYFAALTVPQVLGDYLLGGTVFIAIVPVFTRVRAERGEEAAWRLLAAVLRMAGAALLVLSLAYGVLAGPILSLVVPGFGADAVALAVRLARFLSPALFLMGTVLIGASVIQSFRHFLTTALAGLIPPIVTFGCVYLLSDSLGIYSWALGTVMGLGIQLVVYLRVLCAIGMTLRRPLPYSDGALRSIFALLVPLLLGVLAGQSNTIVQRVLASRIPAGITSLSYSQDLARIPVALLIGPLLGALFPLLAQQAAGDRPDEIRATCAVGIRVVFFLGVPATIFLVAARGALVALLFQWGKFGAAETQMVSHLLAWHALGLCFLGFAVIVARGLCALERPGALLTVNLCRLAACVLHFVLFHHMGVPGLALAISLVHVVAFAAGFALLSRHVGLLLDTGDAVAVMKISLAGVVAGVAGACAVRVAGADHLTRLLAVAAAISLSYLAVAAALRSRELQLIGSRLLGRE